MPVNERLKKYWERDVSCCGRDTKVSQLEKRLRKIKMERMREMVEKM